MRNIMRKIIFLLKALSVYTILHTVFTTVSIANENNLKPSEMVAPTTAEQRKFQEDIQQGFSDVIKKIPPKYLYDEKGSELFNKITKHPDYYLTNTEIGIINKYKKDLSAILSTKRINIVELGVGDGSKASLLIDQFLLDSLDFIYSPVDISATYLKDVVKNFKKKFKNTEINAINADYYLNALPLQGVDRTNVILFLGSSVGNFDPKETEQFLHNIRKSLKKGDYFLIGFDLEKRTDVLIKAYNDSGNITKAFNLNLLERINRELGGNFNIKNFEHFETYNVYTKSMESYLISQINQKVHIKALGQDFYFKAFEPICTEHSYKYNLEMIESFAKLSGFTIIKHYLDKNQYFAISLWQV